jgi:pimeloyl-ACP methyl ester carboxylesterase
MGAERLFLPGWGVRGRLYEPGMPAGWTALEPPAFHRTAGSFDSYLEWIVDEVDRRPGPIQLAGHSMGGALAIAAAASRPARVRRLVLISPAALPLSKPMRESAARLGSQAMRGLYPASTVARFVLEVGRAPVKAHRVARAVHAVDLSREMTLVREASIPSTVIGCATDTIVTPAHCRAAAELLGAEYRELPFQGGHMWMLRKWPLLERELAAA